MTVPSHTTAYSDLCFVGPLGRMLALPDVKSDTPPNVSTARIGGVHRALAGGITVDTFARKRTWTWQWDLLMDKQLALVEAIQFGTIRGPLRLIDPRRYNRLPEDVASAGSVSGTARAFLTDNNSAAYWRPLSRLTNVERESLGPWRLLDGAMEWQVLTPGANYLRARDARYTDQLWRVPVLPGEPLEFSCWNTHPDNASIAAGVSWYDANGTLITADITEYTPGTPTEWSRLAVTAAPPDEAVFCSPYLATQVEFMPVVTSVFTTAWQVCSPSLARLVPYGVTEHCDVPELGGEWRLGGGAPFVVADVGSTSYTRPGFYATGLTLYEN